MSYIPPAYDAADASWEGVAPYTPPAYDAADASWETSSTVSVYGASQSPIGGSAGQAAISPLIAASSPSPVGISSGFLNAGTTCSGVSVSPIGLSACVAYAATSSAGTIAYFSSTGLIGEFNALARQASSTSTLTCDGLIGELNAVATGVVQSSLRSDGLIGTFRSTARSLGDAWGAYGFPPPNLSGYGYSRPEGLQRTDFVSGATRQRRRFNSGWRQGTATFTISSEQLYSVENFVTTQGYNWFTMGLITSDSPGEALSLHLVRAMDNPSVGNSYGDSIEVSLRLEMHG